jgi:hypothetical protein
MKKLNIVNSVLLLLIFLTSFFGIQYKTMLIEYLGAIINSKTTFLIITILVFSISLLHKILYNELDLSKDLKWKKYKDLISEILSLIAEPSFFMCAFSIIKGLIMDYFFNGQYFLKFGDAEKAFLLIASIYFIFQSSIEMYYQTNDLLFKAEEVEV